jgi:hypothetical protein
VYIPPGQNVLLDESTPKLFAVILEQSRLIFDHTMDLSFDAELIFVKEGQLIIGSEEQPLCKKVQLTFHGTPEQK